MSGTPGSSRNQRPSKSNLTGSRVILLTSLLQTTNELEDAGRLSLEYLAMYMRKSLSLEPSGYFMEKSADVLLRLLTPRRPPPASNCSWVCRGPIVVEPIHEGGASNLRTGPGPSVER